MVVSTRRSIIGLGLAVGAAVTGRAQDAAQKGNGEEGSSAVSQAARIDVHQHLLPPEFLAALRRHAMSDWAPHAWSVEGALAMMDKHEIATGMLSLSTPGPNLGDSAEAKVLTRQVNEGLADLVKRRPERFGMFASVPLPDVDLSLDAIRHAYDALSADGVILLTNTRGVYLGDPTFDPVMEELDHRNAVVFVHPGPLPGPPVKGIHPSIEDFLLDTTRAATNLVYNGIPRRFPRLRIILAHGGGFLPYAAYRIAILSNAINAKRDTDQMLADLATFYFDTALSGSPTVFPSLLGFARPGRVLFGSDSPYAQDRSVTFFTNQLDAYQELNASGHAAINRSNAEALFPRLKATP